MLADPSIPEGLSSKNVVYVVIRTGFYDWNADPAIKVDNIYANLTDANVRVRNECPSWARNDADDFKEGIAEDGSLWWEYLDGDGWGRRYHVEVRELKAGGSESPLDWGRPFGEPAPVYDSYDEDDMDWDEDSESEAGEDGDREPEGEPKEKPWYELERERTLSPLGPRKPKPFEKEAIHSTQVGQKAKEAKALAKANKNKTAKEERAKRGARTIADIKTESLAKKAREAECKTANAKKRKAESDAKKKVTADAKKVAADAKKAAAAAKKLADEERKVQDAIQKATNKIEQKRLAAEKKLHDQMEKLAAELEEVRVKAEQEREEQEQRVRAAADNKKVAAEKAAEKRRASTSADEDGAAKRKAAGQKAAEKRRASTSAEEDGAAKRKAAGQKAAEKRKRNAGASREQLPLLANEEPTQEKTKNRRLGRGREGR
jgi:colicin import membrane protein